SGLSIPVPAIVFEKLKITGPAPGTQPTPALAPAVPSPGISPPILPKGGGRIGTPLRSFGIQITSPRSPNDYIPLTSDAGYTALASEQALVHDPTKLPTLEDQIRPHGNFSVQVSHP